MTATHARLLCTALLCAGLATPLLAPPALADFTAAYRLTYPSGASALGPGAARGVNIIVNGGAASKGLGTRPEGESFEVLGVTFLAQDAPDCKEPKTSFEGDVAGAEWDEECLLPGQWVELCIRTNEPIVSITAYFVDAKGGQVATAEVTALPGGCAALDCDAAVAVTPYVWPPNHSLTQVTISGITGGFGDVSVVATGITQDESLNGRGDGNTCPDGAIVDGAAWVRMERAGGGNGRVYVVSFTATDGSGATCDGQVRVCVPHNQGATCVDDGQEVNSLGPCSNGSSAASKDLSVASSMRVVAASGRARAEFALPAAAHVDVGVYDVAGRRVMQVESGMRAAGVQQVSWDATGLARGVYFVRVRAGDVTVSRTLFIAD